MISTVEKYNLKFKNHKKHTITRARKKLKKTALTPPTPLPIIGEGRRARKLGSWRNLRGLSAKVA